jgi:tRNA A-37 threonylcarbamoyl transferase component Bud32
MRMLSIIEFGQLTFDAKELEWDAHGVKVLLRPDDRIVKLFRIKHIVSLALFYPYSLRFRRNAQRLTERGINTVTVEQIFYCHAIRRHGVVYPLLQGDTLEELLESQPDSADLMQRLARYIAQLHHKGIYFRSLHLGNVLLLENGELGLIDVADAHFSSGPLFWGKRVRNFQHLFRRRAHRTLFERFGTERFVDIYLDAAGLPAAQAEKIRKRVKIRP